MTAHKLALEVINVINNILYEWNGDNPLELLGAIKGVLAYFYKLEDEVSK